MILTAFKNITKILIKNGDETPLYQICDYRYRFSSKFFDKYSFGKMQPLDEQQCTEFLHNFHTESSHDSIIKIHQIFVADRPDNRRALVDFKEAPYDFFENCDKNKYAVALRLLTGDISFRYTLERPWNIWSIANCL